MLIKNPHHFADILRPFRLRSDENKKGHGAKIWMFGHTDGQTKRRTEIAAYYNIDYHFTLSLSKNLQFSIVKNILHH